MEILGIVSVAVAAWALLRTFGLEMQVKKLYEAHDKSAGAYNFHMKKWHSDE